MQVNIFYVYFLNFCLWRMKINAKIQIPKIGRPIRRSHLSEAVIQCDLKYCLFSAIDEGEGGAEVSVEKNVVAWIELEEVARVEDEESEDKDADILQRNLLWFEFYW